MAGGCEWSRRVASRARTLRNLVRDTQRALRDVQQTLTIEQDVSSSLEEISHRWTLGTALVILGCNASARVRLLHAIIGAKILPDTLPRGYRWIRIQYGTTTQVHLSLGNSEFELVEDLECNRRPWETLPMQDLKRQGPSDLSTIIEIEINSQFLKDGLQIVIPPDIDTDPDMSSHLQLKTIHAEFYAKRSSILKGFHPVYLYAVDKMGKNVFSDNICSNMVVSKSEEDFWSTYGLYNVNQSVSEEGGETGEGEVWTEGRGEPAVFDSENCLDLHQVKHLNCHAQLLFVLFSDAAEEPTSEGAEREATESTEEPSPEELAEEDRDLIDEGSTESSDMSKSVYEDQVAFMNELIDQWELMTSPPQKHYVKSQYLILNDKELLRTVDRRTHVLTATNNTRFTGSSCLKGRTDKLIDNRTSLLNFTVKFATDVMQSYLLEYCTKLAEIHVKLLQQFILASFDMARELQVVPKRIQYAATQEQYLYEAIHAKFSEGGKKLELVALMQQVLEEMKAEVAEMDWTVDDLPWHRDSISSFSMSPRRAPSPPAAPSRSPSPPPEEASDSTLHEYELISTDDTYSDFFTNCGSVLSADSIPVENEGSLVTRDAGCHSCSVDYCRATLSHTHATYDVHQTVLSRLSRKISMKLVNFVDCLKESYFGTLQRCLESLEQYCVLELGGGGGGGASEAARALAGGAARVRLTPHHARTTLHAIRDALHALLHRLRLSRSEEWCCCPLSARWRRNTALRLVHSLSAHRLANIISEQILENINSAHEKYQNALQALVTALNDRLHHTEDVKLAVRRKFAPLFARLCLESTSMCDLLMHGVPDLGREIGRGHYGVVYAVRGAWAGRAPLAAKSVQPLDARHHRDLAMEFFYTRSIPPHPRIVPVYGCIARGSRGILLISERKVRDLHAAVRAGLTLVQRMTIACDIVEGIRYLHSLGLVHRDIKLKNVLLDGNCRASLSDLGFCCSRALLSGSVVGTPVHMAPDLLAGDYNASVDVYAFGILFWYLCADDVRLPAAFETSDNKEQLWTNVKKGVRPERLPCFLDSWWEVMQWCWQAAPAARPPPGALAAALHDILAHARTLPGAHARTHTRTIHDDGVYEDY